MLGIAAIGVNLRRSCFLRAGAGSAGRVNSCKFGLYL